jgi:hypothetical protein
MPDILYLLTIPHPTLSSFSFPTYPRRLLLAATPTPSTHNAADPPSLPYPASRGEEPKVEPRELAWTTREASPASSPEGSEATTVEEEGHEHG